jgi:hypothetical protein
VYAITSKEEHDIDLCISIAKKKHELSIVAGVGHSYAIEAAVKCLAALAQEVEGCTPKEKVDYLR